MKEFSFFIATKAVKKQTPDKNQAQALARESNERLQLAKSINKAQKPKYVLENAYEAIRELIDAILAGEGYKSYSHEASVAYLHNLGFSITDIMQMDRLRKRRNGIKYYGEDAAQEEADEALKIASDLTLKLLKKLQLKE